MLTRAEALLASATAALATAILAAYLPFRAGWHVSPAIVLLFTVAGFIGCASALSRPATDRGGGAVAAAAAIATAGWFLWLARPDLLPVGGGPDLTHHLVLINHIQRTWRLVDDPALYPYLGDMMDYTPGSHLLIALTGDWLRVDGLRAVQPVLAICAGLKAGFVFVIARRLAPSPRTNTLAGVAAALVLLLPYQYFAGSFTTLSYWPQVVSELFACACWWTLIAWHDTGSRRMVTLFAIFGAALFVVWPIWLGPVVLLAAAVILAARSLPVARRLTLLSAALIPIAIVAAVHTVGRAGRLQMAGTSGFVIAPSIATLGWPFIVLSAAGVVSSIRRERYSTVPVFLGSIAVQAGVLDAVARSQGSSTPYMALKMMYLAIYPLAVSASALVPTGVTAALGLVVAMAAASIVSVVRAPKPAPIVSRSAWQAGTWARQRVDRACVDYLVADGYTGYWLHLAVLDNPRGTGRFNRPDTFEPQKAVARWVEVEGLPYAIVDDVNGFSKALFSGTETVAQFGRSMVIRRRGPSSCPPD